MPNSVKPSSIPVTFVDLTKLSMLEFVAPLPIVIMLCFLYKSNLLIKINFLIIP